MMSTRLSETRRVIRNTTMPLRDGLGTTPQNWFNEACIWANTVVEPNSRAATPSTVGRRPALTDARAADGSFNGLRGLGSDQRVYLRRYLAARRLLTKDGAGDRDHNDQQRRQREQRVKRQRTRMLERIIRQPEVNRILQQRQTASSGMHEGHSEVKNGPRAQLPPTNPGPGNFAARYSSTRLPSP